MYRVFCAIFAIVLVTGVVNSQEAVPAASPEIKNMGVAPKKPNGVGRLDLRVFDEQGNPVKGAEAKLVSKRSDGFQCESWGATNAMGVAVLPPLHMGNLKLKIKAKGFKTQSVEVPASSLGEPVKVTLLRK
jgi:hypothetical protein